ncbi:tRNA 2-selenouridine(34) synthase MnmH [Rhodobacteraceae bacterium F11138]|nr:tRNA 2-selenouridine(34) synthase MnmH [Rhodobacteraceae bacterium F11138]
MSLRFETLTALLNHGFDTVIDVRSPAEFAEDHVPGAINLPVLDNRERAEVGTIYKQQSPFLARKLGAAMVFRNAAHHVETTLKDHGGGWRPLVYCWRGGQRSGSFGWMLEQIGWRSEVIEGGYRSYRRLVSAMLYDRPLPHPLIALDGYTGTAKTDLLHMMQARGVQVLDLEGLAGHRGSILGQMPGGQPSQKAFETRLAMTLTALDPSRPVLIEAESSKIGRLIVPPSLWGALKRAPRITVTAPIETRAAYLARAYHDVLADSEALKSLLDNLRVYRGHDIVDGWFAQIDAADRTGLTRALMVQHYDPSYDKSRKAVDAPVLARLHTGALDMAGLECVAARIERLLAENPQPPVVSDS